MQFQPQDWQLTCNLARLWSLLAGPGDAWLLKAATCFGTSQRYRFDDNFRNNGGRGPGRQSIVTPTGRWNEIHGMNWKLDLDALIESAMAFARDTQRQEGAVVPIALTTAEQVLADRGPVQPTAAIAPAASEREEIQQRVKNFRAHQQTVARQREDFYLQTRARMMGPPTINLKSPAS